MRDKKDRESLGIYLKTLREKKGYSLDQVCEGLCTPQQLSKLEKGDKATSKLLQDTLLERLGVGAEDYEHYLSHEAYDHWEMRQRILHWIVWGKPEPARALLKEYYCRYAKDSEGSPKVTDRLERQFCLSIWAQIRILERAAGEELGAIIDEAAGLTMPALWQKPLKEQALSFKELNLILEAERYRKGGPRAEHYMEVLAYMETSGADYLGMAKIYPKAVCLLCECGTGTVGRDAESLLAYCDRAVEFLRNALRLYHLWELLDIRGRYLKRILDDPAGSGGRAAAGEPARLYQENEAWKNALESVYAKFHMPKATLSYCYLYIEKNVSCVNDVIRIRRRMLGMERKALCEGICDEKTLMRLENRKANPQRAVAAALFERLGLAGTLSRTALVTESPEAKRLMAKQRRYINNHDTEKADAILEQIKSLISVDIRCNRQVLMQQEANLQRQRGEIDNETYCRKMRATLELTLPFNAFLREGEKYLTHQEQMCIQNMMQGMDKEGGEFWTCMERFQEMYRPAAESELLETMNGIYGFVMRYVQSELGNHGEYDQSDRYVDTMLAEELHSYRLPSIARCLYARWWNFTQRKQRGIPTSRELDAETELSNCIQLSRLSKLTSDESFFMGKLRHEREDNA